MWWSIAQNWEYATPEDKYRFYDVLEKVVRIAQPFEVDFSYIDFDGDIKIQTTGGDSYRVCYLDVHNQFVDENTWLRNQEDYYESPGESDDEEEEQ